MNDLGTLGGDACSRALSVNLPGQVVGESGPNCGADPTQAFLWENGTMYNLNDLIPPGSGLTLTFAWDINDRGVIAGQGLLSNGDSRAYLLVPCDQGDPGGCTNQLMETTDTLSHPNVAPDKIDQLRNRPARSSRGRS